MKKITQTGHIPMNSLGILLWNYIRFFKVFFVFYIMPLCFIAATFYWTSKEKIMTIIQSLIQLMIVEKIAHNNQALIASAQDAVVKNLLNFLSTPLGLTIVCASVILMLICASCLHVGLKHVFYEKSSIIAIAKEGCSKIFDFLWTMISTGLLSWLGGIFLALFILIAIFLGPLGIIPAIIGYIIFFSLFIFYIPIHFFSDNNPFSSLMLSFKTFWNNIFSMIGIGIVFFVVYLVISALLMAMIIGPVYLYMKGHYPNLPKEVLASSFGYIVAAIAYLFIPYTMGWNWLFGLMTFVAYPELLDEDKVNTDIQITSNSNNEEYPSLPKEFFNDQNSKNISEQNFSGSNNTYQNKPVIKPSSGAEGLSVPNQNHQNNRPFLNQKIDQREFDRFTSRDQN